jgi:hypothetical protein
MSSSEANNQYSSVSINIIGKEYFQSKNAISRLKSDLKSGVNVLKEYSKYLKEGYMFTINKDDNDINSLQELRSNAKVSMIIKVIKIENNDDMLKKKVYFDLKMKELKEKRLSNNSQKNIVDKAKVKYNINDDILKLYYELKKYVDRPVLNPVDVYGNKEQYIPIIKELCLVFKGDNPYSKYYNMLLSSLN